jgi:hypothetical protein
MSATIKKAAAKEKMVDVGSLFEKYFTALRKIPLDEKTEHTDRAALQHLLQTLATNVKPSIAIQHEPKRATDKGAPDFKVSDGGLILGYVENKAVGENLSKVLKSAQLIKYQDLSDNIIVTDYLSFIWINEDGPPRKASLCDETDLENRKFKLPDEAIATVADLLRAFLSVAPKGISRAQDLALALATRSRLLRDYLGEELIRQEATHKEGRLYGLFQIFRDQVFHELTLADFADAFAQMLAYGLFLARLNSNDQAVTLQNARQFVPGSFTLIRELVDFLAELDKPEYRVIRWVVEEVLSIVNTLQLDDIHDDLSFDNRKAISKKIRAKDEEEWRLFSRDPFVYFYEDYLAKYDSEMKKTRGVYYTPPPIVNFIVRSVDEILKSTFKMNAGLADHKRVTVLDFACGTGTFLVEVFERVFDNIGGASGKRNLIVRDHLLKNIFGFEYLIAPYTIAHLKLSQYLREQKYELSDDERFQIFLTNTLEPIEPQKNYLLPALSGEIEAAQNVKERPILVITGNPPYAAYSKNKGEWITKKIEDYKIVDGAHFNERKHWLQDDYVKFIRFAQSKMETVEQGIVAVITNHSWIYNPTFRGMRQSLMKTFDQIHIVDLHGSTKPKEWVPEGRDNGNVFDIMKGVAVTLFIKKSGLAKGVWFGDVWGTRLEKYKICAGSIFSDLAIDVVKPESPFYFLSPRVSPDISGWSDHRSLVDIFLYQSSGFLSARDDFNIQFTAKDVASQIKVFKALEAEPARKKFNLGKDSRDWKVSNALDDVKQSKASGKMIRSVCYRPFDDRYVYYTGQSRGIIGQPAAPLAEHLEVFPLALGTTRRVEEGDFRHAFAFSKLPDGHSVSSKETTHVFPLYMKGVFGEKTDNWKPEFKKFIKQKYGKEPTPETIFGYIYAVLNCPVYRDKFEDFLADDYARIPFPDEKADFEALAKLGWALSQAHTMKEIPPPEGKKTTGKKGKVADDVRFEGTGSDTIEAVRYELDKNAIFINDTQSFSPVLIDVWRFTIGTYQVLERYLKSRTGHEMSLDEIDHFLNVVRALTFSNAQMAKIDVAYVKAFPG